MASATPLRASGTARQDNQKENEQPSCNQADAALSKCCYCRDETELSNLKLRKSQDRCIAS
jgi:hypothetical protein